MAGRFPVCEQVCGVGQDLVNKGHTARAEIGNHIKTLMVKWKQLQDQAAARRTKLEDAVEAHQVLFDFLVIVKAGPHECVIRTGQP